MIFVHSESIIKYDISLHGISSMATRSVLSELSTIWQAARNTLLDIKFVGGVEAAQRVENGEEYDVVFLASDVIDRLITNGYLLNESKVDLMQSNVGIAIPEGAPEPDISTESALRKTVLAAHRIGYSTGPSGKALAQLFQRWGIFDSIRDRIVVPSPGLPVGALVAQGKVDIGFQQVSELIHLPGIRLVGELPPAIKIVTIFSGAIGARSKWSAEVRDLLAFIASPATDTIKLQHGMFPMHQVL